MYRNSRLTAKCSSETVHDRMPVILKLPDYVRCSLTIQ